MRRKLMFALTGLAGALLVASGAVATLLIVGDDDKGGSASAGNGMGYLGLTVTATAPAQGLRVASVIQGGPADSAGIEVGDLIRSVDGQVVRTPEQLRTAVESKAPGSRVTVTYERADREHQVAVRLGEAPANAQIEATPAPQPGQPGERRPVGPDNRGRLGVQVQNITPALIERFSLSRDSGVVIVAVLPESAASRAGFRAGDIITSVNGKRVATDREVTLAVAEIPAGQQASIGVLRGSEELTLNVTISAASNLPGFENLPPALQERLRELAENGELTPEQLRRFGMGQNLVYGTVKSISDTTLTLTRLDGALQRGSDVTFTLDGSTQYRSGSDTISRADIREGSAVAVVSLDGRTALAVLLFQR